MSRLPELSTETILAEASRLLVDAEYVVVREAEVERLRPERTLLAEDRYSVVLLAVFDTWAELEISWADAEATLNGLMTERLSKSDPKTWEGYLALMTSDLIGPTAHERADVIRLDTSRLRKLVATGDELQTISDVERMLLPLLPVEPSALGTPISDVLDQLPQLLEEEGVDRNAADAVVTAFASSEPIMEALRESLEVGR